MDLFVVNRYVGDNENDTKNEEANLDKILKKINKRKLARERRKLQESGTLKENTQHEDKKLHEKENPSENIEDKEEDKNYVNLDLEEPQPKKAKVDPSNIEGFTILGVDKFDKKKSVKRVLPKWLRNPTVITSSLDQLTAKVSHTNLNKILKRKLKKDKQIKYLFPVQAEFIPWQQTAIKNSDLIVPSDVCVSAPTGSGKTFAFTLPILHHFLEQIENQLIAVKAIRTLIILPTQNLALQIYNTLNSLCTETGIKVGLATGSGTGILETEQRQLISYNSVWGASSKVDILVCTPGRLVDHLKNTKGFDLTHLQYVIIDEADRVLDSIQDDWLYHLGIHLQSNNDNKCANHNILNLESLKKRTDPQKLLFSATLSQDPEKLQKLSLFQPKLFTCTTDSDDMQNNLNVDSERFVGKYTTPSELTEKYVICTIDKRPLILYKLIMDEINKSPTSRILVFVNTVETLHRLNILLDCMSQGCFSVSEISSNRGNLIARNELLRKFECGQIQVLVCTDSMARGIDIPNVNCVISYSVPAHLKTYIHRAGRTARAGSEGLCISMLHAKQEQSHLKMLAQTESRTKDIEKIEILDDDLTSLIPLYEQSLAKLGERVNTEIQQSIINIKKKKKFNNKNILKKRRIAKQKIYNYTK